MKTLKIAIFVLLPSAFSLWGCGLKRPPVPLEDAEIICSDPCAKPGGTE